MEYKPIITESEAHGLTRTKKQGLYILNNGKFIVHNIQVYKSKKVALCDSNNNVIHIITRATYQKYITPELKFV